MERPHAAVRASEELVRLINEVTIPIRKLYGMAGLIQIAAVDVTPDEMTVRVWTRRSIDPDKLAPNIRNAFLNYLVDSVPCEWFRCRFVDPDDPERCLQEIRLPYARMARRAGLLGSSVILIEPNVAPKRQAFRARLLAAWRRLLEAWPPGTGPEDVAGEGPQQIRGS